MRLVYAVAACGAMALSCSVAFAGQVDTATYTRVMFSNAPESILRVQSWKPRADGVLLTTVANACAPRPGSQYRVLVKGADASTFRAGELLITGMARPTTGNFWAIRPVSDNELQSLGGCPRRSPH